ncbi:MAG: methyltransferase domain-containing protein [Gammaproteobacteria bacterium]|nr:methyltransferase domain-containing protein [Gammaproteobacteria bacterium]
MTQSQNDLKETLKKRLFDSISAQIDLIAYVPADIDKLLKNFTFDTEAVGQSPADVEFSRRSEQDAKLNLTENSNDKDSLANQVNNYYDQAFYSNDGIMGILLADTEYRNIGYWDEATITQNKASEQLQDALLDFIPEKSGRILDVACGMGASTRRLLNHYPAENIWAINISAKQLESTRRNAPGCNAQVMNAVEMKFEDNFFDNILCIEAAFHFETRQKFLEDAHRTLKQGGRLVLSDTLFTSKERLEQHAVFPSPENHIESTEEYRKLLSDVGFDNIIINDVSEEVWGAHFLHTVNLVHQKFYKGNLNIVQLTEILWTYYHLNAITRACLFVSAQK